MTIEAPAHIPYDFSNLPLTNEQKILACLERIEVLLTTPETRAAATAAAKLAAMPSRAEQIDALAAKAGTRRK